MSCTLQRGQVPRRLLDEQGAIHEIARLEPIEQPRLRNLERHRHTGHQSADVFVLDCDFQTSAIDGENLTVQFVALRPRTAAQHGRGADQERNKSTHHCTLT